MGLYALVLSTILYGVVSVDLVFFKNYPLALVFLKSMEFSCKSRGFSISGKAIIRKDDIHVTVNLPMLAMAFKGLVKAGMDKQIPKYLE